MMEHAHGWRILSERFDEDRVKAFSVHQTLYDLCQKKRVEIKNNDFLLAGFDEIFSTIFSKYRENDSEQQLPSSSDNLIVCCSQ